MSKNKDSEEEEEDFDEKLFTDKIKSEEEYYKNYEQDVRYNKMKHMTIFVNTFVILAWKLKTSQIHQTFLLEVFPQ